MVAWARLRLRRSAAHLKARSSAATFGQPEGQRSGASGCAAWNERSERNPVATSATQMGLGFGTAGGVGFTQTRIHSRHSLESRDTMHGGSAAPIVSVADPRRASWRIHDCDVANVSVRAGLGPDDP
eukprot:352791-Chlamydomonas_euryale.AAC.4